ncbi:hypothetical protein GPA10_16360 [Streptomyces sp. p1417]|uniref:Ig-like domain-containing protein n=2 Tax=Streptomyces typhae TaxID=2681492 RepID=A0A6L6WXR2_9ACTN|nr:hypothetical protein [Streptomyces typhae]
MGLYVLDRTRGTVRGHTATAPSSTGEQRPSAVRRIAAPLPGDGVVFHYPLKGLGTAKDGDTAARGVWLTGPTVTDVGPGPAPGAGGTVLVAQGAALTEVETATGTARRSLTLPGGGRFAVDAARGSVWSADLAGNKLYRVDTASFTVRQTVRLPVREGSEGFTAVDPATGSVWVGRQDEVTVFGPDGAVRGTVGGPDLARDVAFDGPRAYVARQDVGDPDAPDYDGRGSLTVLDTTTLKPVAEPVPLPGNEAQLGSAAVAVAPGGAEVFVTSPAEGLVSRIERNTPPKVTESPADATADTGDRVTFTARAEGAPEPSVRWLRSTDSGRSWQPVAGATSPSYTFKARAEQDGQRFRAEFTNDAGTARSEPATLTVRAGSGGTGSATGPQGQRLTVAPARDLAVRKQRLTVSGTGYDRGKGVYAALCVDNGPGRTPTPCVGGAATDGASKASAWITDDPPPQGADLTTPYGENGSFEVVLTVDARDGSTDCRRTRCVLATRADHTRPDDRSQDVRVPVTFADTGGPGDGGPGDDAPGDGRPGDEGPGDDGGSPDGGSAGPGSGGADGGGAAGGGGASDTAGDPNSPGPQAGSDPGPGPGGSLASTGQTVTGAAALAAALTAAGWYALRRARRNARSPSGA